MHSSTLQSSMYYILAKFLAECIIAFQLGMHYREESKTERSDFGAHQNRDKKFSQDQTERKSKTSKKRDKIVPFLDPLYKLDRFDYKGVI